MHSILVLFGLCIFLVSLAKLNSEDLAHFAYRMVLILKVCFEHFEDVSLNNRESTSYGPSTMSRCILSRKTLQHIGKLRGEAHGLIPDSSELFVKFFLETLQPIGNVLWIISEDSVKLLLGQGKEFIYKEHRIIFFLFRSSRSRAEHFKARATC